MGGLQDDKIIFIFCILSKVVKQITKTLLNVFTTDDFLFRVIYSPSIMAVNQLNPNYKLDIPTC